MRLTSHASHPNGLTRLAMSALAIAALVVAAPAWAQTDKPNIVVIFGDDIGRDNISVWSKGLMGYRSPNIDRIAAEGMTFTDYYAESFELDSEEEISDLGGTNENEIHGAVFMVHRVSRFSWRNWAYDPSAGPG